MVRSLTAPDPARWRVPVVLGALWMVGTVLGLHAQAAAQQEGPHVQLLERAAERYQSMDALCAEFTQVMRVPLLGSEVHSQGTLCQRRPHFFTMDFSDPPDDRIVADGDHLWIYFPSTQPGQVVRSPLGAAGAMDFHREFLDRPMAKYVVSAEGSETLGGVETQRVRLEPRASAGYVRATVWIDTAEALIRQVEIEQDNGSVRRVTLSDLDTAPRIGQETFEFQVPEGTRVVAMDGMVGGR